MPVRTWAKNDYATNTVFDYQDLNSIGNSTRQIGYGLTPGTVTVDGNGNTISNLGNVVSTLFTSVGAINLRGPDNGSTLRNIIRFARATDGADQHLIMSDPSNSNQLYIAPGVGGGATSVVRIGGSVHFNGDIIIDGKHIGGDLYGGATGSAVSLNGGDVFATGGASIALRGKTNGYNAWGMEFYAGGAELMRLTAAGKVGIGTITPGYKLSFGLSGASRTLAIYDDGSEFLGFGVGVSELRYDAGSGSRHSFYVSGGNEALRVSGAAVQVTNSAWNSGHFMLGSYHIWVDGSGRLRIKSSAPTSDSDGTVVGAQV